MVRVAELLGLRVAAPWPIAIAPPGDSEAVRVRVPRTRSEFGLWTPSTTVPALVSVTVVWLSLPGWVTGRRVKCATTERALLIVTVQGPWPVQAPAQPVKMAVLAGLAVSVT